MEAEGLPQAAIDRVLKRRKSLHVFNDIDPARTAHVVVDLQNGFMAEGQPAEAPPTAPKARTGELTPPGMTWVARE